MDEFDPSLSHLGRIQAIAASNVGDLIYIGRSVNLSPWSAKSYLEELRNPESIMLRLVSDENKTLGFVVGRLVKTGEDNLDAEIYNIAVKVSEQGKGYGQRLLSAFMGRCHERGVCSVWLEVRESNETAISFYKRNGFVQVQRRNHFYTEPREHGWLMRSNLKADDA